MVRFLYCFMGKKREGEGKGRRGREGGKGRRARDDSLSCWTIFLIVKQLVFLASFH